MGLKVKFWPNGGHFKFFLKILNHRKSNSWNLNHYHQKVYKIVKTHSFGPFEGLNWRYILYPRIYVYLEYKNPFDIEKWAKKLKIQIFLVPNICDWGSFKMPWTAPQWSKRAGRVSYESQRQNISLKPSLGTWNQISSEKM